jgi:hypothetical protein
VYAAATNLALKTVFLSCLKCTHPAAAPWKDRLTSALKEIEGGGQAAKAKDLFYKTNGSIQDKDSVEDTKVICSSFVYRCVCMCLSGFLGLCILNTDLKANY